MGKTNYPLLLGLSAFLLIVAYSTYSNLSAQTWHRDNVWALFVLTSTASLTMLVEVLGLLRERTVETLAVLDLYLLALLAIDALSMGTANASVVRPFIVAGLVLVTYALAARMVFPEGENIVFPVAVGLALVTLYHVLLWRAQPVAVASLLAAWGVLLLGGLTTVGKRGERGLLYAVGGLALSLTLIAASALVTVLFTGFAA